MKIKKKFYVASKKMHPWSDSEYGNSYNEWAHATLEQAIEHAKELAEENDEDQIVVQMVRVVRRQKTPLIVEKV